MISLYGTSKDSRASNNKQASYISCQQIGTKPTHWQLQKWRESGRDGSVLLKRFCICLILFDSFCTFSLCASCWSAWSFTLSVFRSSWPLPVHPWYWVSRPWLDSNILRCDTKKMTIANCWGKLPLDISRYAEAEIPSLPESSWDSNFMGSAHVLPKATMIFMINDNILTSRKCKNTGHTAIRSNFG